MEKILEIKDLNKSFGLNHVLKDISFSMQKGEVIAIIGSSGGGKSTLLRCLTFLEKAQSGSIWIGGEEIVSSELKPAKPKFMLVQKIPCGAGKKLKFVQKIDENGKKKLKFFVKVDVENTYKRKFFQNYVPKDEYGNPLIEMFVSIYPKDAVLREKALKMGLVFQDFNLFPHKTVIENLILAPMLVKKIDKQQALEIAEEQLAKVGLSDKANAYPCEISGGQKQRVAIARAIAKNPKLLLCDEPTGALDYKTGKQILSLLEKTSRKENMTIVIVTHNSAIADMADKVIKFKNGSVEDIIINKNPKPIEDIEW